MIYPRYIETGDVPGPTGLTVMPFRADTPYRGEDLFYARRPTASSRAARATWARRRASASTRDLSAATSSRALPRAWLGDWRVVLKPSTNDRTVAAGEH